MTADSLLILDPGRDVAEVEVLAPVRQRYGDRVVIVGAAAAAALAGLGRLVAAGEVAPEPGSAFSETERMGILAWNARADVAAKQRPADGLNWDTPGFEPP